MLLKTAICDDDTRENELLFTYIRQFELEFDIDFRTTSFISGNNLLATYSFPGAYDIVFLDVEMPDINGLEVASKIRELKDNQVKIIFISNYPEYMQDSFEVQAYNYLPKPLTYETFKKILLKIVKDYENSYTNKLIIHNDNSSELINVDKIIYIQSIKEQNNLLEFVMSEKSVFGKGVLSDWENDLTKYNFISPHRGILVNMNYVHYFNNSSLTLTNGTIIPVSRRREKELRTIFARNIITTIIND